MNNMNQPNHASLFQFSYFFFKPYWRWVVLYILIGIFSGILLPMDSYFSKILINNLTKINIDESIAKTIILPAVIIVMVWQIHAWCWRAFQIIKGSKAYYIENDIINYSFNYVHKQSYNFFQNTLGGTLSHNITTLADKIENLFFDFSAHIVRGITQAIVSLVAMYFVHPAFAFGLFIWIVIFIGGSSLVLKKMTVLSDDYAASKSSTSGKLVDSIGNFSNVKIFGQEKYESNYLQDSLLLMKKRFWNKEWFVTKINFWQGIAAGVLHGFMYFMLIKLRIEDKVTIGDFVLIIGLMHFVIDNVWWLADMIGQINEAIGAAKQSLRAIFTPIEITDKLNASNLIVTKGEIIFDKVHFQYKGNDKFFQNKSIKISSGQKIGLVGYSGSGKSTFVNLILRLYDISDGAILIDNQDIRDVTQESLHQNIGMIPQDPSLFHRTLMENIRYGRIDASDEEVIEAAKQAHAHEFIDKLPLKYESLVGERGIKLSGGQRQRIAIARAILKNAPILILDEATSALDSVVEHEIQESLELLMKGKTTIVIAHRLSTLLHMDRILVFDNGVIIEDGNHEELLMNDGRYKELWDAQVGGFLPEKKEKNDDR